MKTKLTLSGGWHNCLPISVYLDIPEGLIMKTARAIEEDNSEKIAYFREIIFTEYTSKSQRYRLWHHFCGIQDCWCCSYSVADIDFTNLLKNAAKLKENEK